MAPLVTASVMEPEPRRQARAYRRTTQGSVGNCPRLPSRDRTGGRTKAVSPSGRRPSTPSSPAVATTRRWYWLRAVRGVRAARKRGPLEPYDAEPGGSVGWSEGDLKCPLYEISRPAVLNAPARCRSRRGHQCPIRRTRDSARSGRDDFQVPRRLRKSRSLSPTERRAVSLGRDSWNKFD